MDAGYVPVAKEMQREVYSMLTTSVDDEGNGGSGGSGEREPAILAIVRNKTLVHYDLSAFVAVDSNSAAPTASAADGRGEHKGSGTGDEKERKVIMLRKPLSDRRVVSACLTVLVDRALLLPYLVLLFLDDNGMVGCTSLDPGQHPAAHVSLLNDSGLYVLMTITLLLL